MRFYLTQHGLALPKDVNPDRPRSSQGRDEVRRLTDVLGNADMLTPTRDAGRRMTPSDLTLPRSAAAWKSPAFQPTLVDELQTLGPYHPVLRPLLQASLMQTSAVAEAPIGVQVLSTQEEPGRIRVHVGVFYAGIIAGCNCADDPSPVDAITEHCELVLDIDPGTGRAGAALCER
jgi:hypothetical protein